MHAVRRRSNGRRLVALGLALIAGGATLSGCGGEDGASGAGGAADKGTIGLSLNGMVPYTQCLATGVMKALDGTGYELVVRQADFTTSKELSNIESMISTGVKGLIVQPTTTESAARGARQAKAAGIPVSGALAPGAGGLENFVGTVSVEEEQAGQGYGEWLIEHVPEGGKVVVVQGSLGQGRSEAIDKGLDAALAGHDEFQIVARQPGDFDRGKAITIVQNALKAHPDVKVVISYAAAMGNGIAQYLKQSGHEDVINITRDGDEEMLKWIETPFLKADMYYSAAQVGELMAQQVMESIAAGGKRVEPFTRPTDQQMRTAEQLASAPPLCYDEYLAQVKEL